MIVVVLGWIGVAAPAVDEPPLVGQPAHFCGAIGARFGIAVRAEPTELTVEEPLRLTVVLEAAGGAARPPRRPRLETMRGFADRFYIEKNPSDDPDRVHPNGQRWEFDYRLRPKHPDVPAIPRVTVAYYRPGLVPPSRGYQTIASESIPLRVRPRPPTAAAIDAPAFLLEERLEPERWLRRAPWPSLDPSWLLAAWLVPAGGCLAWYGLWRWRHPEAAWRARQRRSRAARQALAALRNGDGRSATGDIVADYLRQRFDLPVAEPTPEEVAELLRRQGRSEEAVAWAYEFFRRWDERRFAGGAAAGAPPDLAADAAQLIALLEDGS
ncbi:MAG: BatD family protein [Gemmataceae bacterium]|nr:BatD family protein [Gemmataceae bacterium]MDW8264255.1 BatD family protein [Gemmataceae bacterium]